MHSWVQRGLRTALLTGGFLAVGAGVAAADENDLTADLLGVTATVPVADDVVVQTPVLTGHGGNTTIGSGTGGGIELPLDTNTVPGTTVLGSDGTGGVSVPVRVTEATDVPPDPRDGLTATVPVNTSGGGSAGTTITVPVVTGDVGGVLDGDPTTESDIDVDLDGPLVLGPDGVLVDAEDTVTFGSTDGRTARGTVLELPAGLEGDRPTTLTLPLGGGDGTVGPLSGNDVNVHLGRVFGDGRPPAGDEPTGNAEPALSVPVDTGNLLAGLVGGQALTGNAVDVHLGDLLGAGSGTGSVVSVPVNGNGSGTGSDNEVRVTLPIGRADDGTGADGEPGSGDGSAGNSGVGTGGSDGSGRDDGDGAASNLEAADGAGSGSGSGGCAREVDGAGWTSGSHTEAAGSGNGTGSRTGEATGTSAGTPGKDGGAPCGVGDLGAAATRSSASGLSTTALAGMLAASTWLLLALAGGRRRGDRSQR